MATFTITDVEPDERRWTTDDGQRTFIYTTVRFEGEQGRGVADMKRPLGGVAPTVGQVLEGYEIAVKGDKRELKKEAGSTPRRGGGNGGGWKSKSDSERAEIRASVAVKAAVELLAIEAQARPDKLREEGTTALDLLDPRINYFESRLKRAAEQA